MASRKATDETVRFGRTRAIADAVLEALRTAISQPMNCCEVASGLCAPRANRGREPGRATGGGAPGSSEPQTPGGPSSHATKYSLSCSLWDTSGWRGGGPGCGGVERAVVPAVV